MSGAQITETKKKKLLNELALSEISYENFLSRALLGLCTDEDFAENWLRNALREQQALDVQFGLALVRTPDMPVGFDVSSDILCKLLFSPWHFSHEDIAFLLYQMRNVESVDCLYSASTLQFEYLNYDTTFQFARKCIKALSAINNSDAVDKLRLLATAANPVISKYAKKELSRL